MIFNLTQGDPALVTFVTVGYPTLEDTVPILLAMQEGGTDIIELGVPFSDPIADGPAIQETNAVSVAMTHVTQVADLLRKIAVKNGVDYATCLGVVREARKKGLTTPVLLMGASIVSANGASTQDPWIRILQPHACVW